MMLSSRKTIPLNPFFFLIFEKNVMINRLLCFLCFISAQMFAQEQNVSDSIEKTNPIIFVESFGGIGGGSAFNFFGGFGLNYQFRKTDLITIRTAAIIGTSREYAALSPIVIFPF